MGPRYDISRDAFARMVAGGGQVGLRISGPEAAIVPARVRMASRVGASDPTATLTAADIAALDGNVNTLNSDFLSSQGATNASALAIWASNWAAFLADWKAWFGQHGAGTGLGGALADFFTDASLKAEFDSFVGRYNELRRQWTAPATSGGLAMSTSATPAVIPDVSVPFFTSITNALGTFGTIALGLGLAIGGVELYRYLEQERRKR